MMTAPAARIVDAGSVPMFATFVDPADEEPS